VLSMVPRHAKRDPSESTTREREVRVAGALHE
jgi:hypothetical protein